MRLFAFLACFIFLGAANAQTAVPKIDQEGRKGDVGRAMKEKAIARFDTSDDDKDGKISRAEASKHSAYLTENFDKLDKNKDGFLDWEEFVGHNRWPR